MAYRYDYNNPPEVVDSYVWSDNKGKLHTIMGWLGFGRLLKRYPGKYGRTDDGRLGTIRYRLSDGTEAQWYPVQSKMPGWSAILYGATDVTGQFWQNILGTKAPCWNHLELGNQLSAEAGDPALLRIVEYARSKAPLQMGDDPLGWPRQYREAWIQGVAERR